MITLTFRHVVCRICGLAWKETTEQYGMPRTNSTCPRCHITPTQLDVVKTSEETYP